MSTSTPSNSLKNFNTPSDKLKRAVALTFAKRASKITNQHSFLLKSNYLNNEVHQFLNVFSELKDFLNPEETDSIIQLLISHYQGQRSLHEAIKWNRYNLQRFGDDTHGLSKSLALQNHAMLLMKLGDLRESECFFKLAIDAFVQTIQRLSIPAYDYLIFCLDSLGSVCLEMQKDKDAELLCQKAIEINKRLLYAVPFPKGATWSSHGCSSSPVYSLRFLSTTLVDIYLYQGKLFEAEVSLKNAFSILFKWPDKDNTNLLEATVYYSRLGRIRMTQGQYEEASELFQKAKESSPLPNHEVLAALLYEVGCLKFALQEYEQSAQYLLDAKRMWNKFYGDNSIHPFIAQVYCKLSQIQDKTDILPSDQNFKRLAQEIALKATGNETVVENGMSTKMQFLSLEYASSYIEHVSLP